MKTRTTTTYLGKSKIVMTTDVINGEDFDTKVEINGVHLCCVAGAEKNAFIDALADVVCKYEI